jgi:hypothetical protein
VSTATGSEAAGQLIGSPFGADEPALADFVAHRIGEGLDGVLAGDDIAVHVYQRVELVEAKAAVAPEEGETC